MPINTINQEWLRGLQDLLDKGVVVKPRDLPVLEITGYQTTVDMESPILVVNLALSLWQQKLLGSYLEIIE